MEERGEKTGEYKCTEKLEGNKEKYCLSGEIPSRWRFSFSSCGLPRVSKFSTKAWREKMLLKNSNTAFALVIRSLWGSDELRHRPVPCKPLANVRGCSVSMVHTGVEMGPSLL